MTDVTKPKACARSDRIHFGRSSSSSSLSPKTRWPIAAADQLTQSWVVPTSFFFIRQRELCARRIKMQICSNSRTRAIIFARVCVVYTCKMCGGGPGRHGMTISAPIHIRLIFVVARRCASCSRAIALSSQIAHGDTEKVTYLCAHFRHSRDFVPCTYV